MPNDLLTETVLVPIHRAGWPFIAGFAAAGVLLMLVAPWLGWLGLGLTAWCVYFFRDPPRVVPTRPGLVVSPADGRVCAIGPAPWPRELGGEGETRTRISVFLSVFDVHVNRAPVTGTIDQLAYVPGKFVNAALDKASLDNERCALAITDGEGRTVGCVQIAGLIARRIVTWVKAGETVAQGQRFGLIRFGSRVDVYLPPEARPLVIVGQRSIGGETVLADLASSEPARQGERR